MGYARTQLHGGELAPPRLPRARGEVARFHPTLEALHRDFGDTTLNAKIGDEQFLQGPLADVMTHTGQLAFLRRLQGSPIASENFIFPPSFPNVGAHQALPKAPDPDGRAENMPRTRGSRARPPAVATEPPNDRRLSTAAFPRGIARMPANARGGQRDRPMIAVRTGSAGSSRNRGHCRRNPSRRRSGNNVWRACRCIPAPNFSAAPPSSSIPRRHFP